MYSCIFSTISNCLWSYLDLQSKYCQDGCLVRTDRLRRCTRHKRNCTLHDILYMIYLDVLYLILCKRLHSHWSREGLLVVWSFVCSMSNGPIQRKIVVDYPLVINSKVKPFSRADTTKKKEWRVQPVFCKVDTGSCFSPFFA